MCEAAVGSCQLNQRHFGRHGLIARAAEWRQRHLPGQPGGLQSAADRLELSLVRAAFGQEFCGASAATFVWTVVPERTEWRYAEASAKVIALDAGHVCQNLYLACEAIGAGTCAVGAYDQELMDELLGLDGDDEFTIYLAPVGKVPTR